MYPTFLQKQRGFTPQQAALTAIVYNIGAILGGLIVKVGSRMVDSSLKSKLQRLKLAMKGVG